MRNLRVVSSQAGNAVNCFIASVAQLHGLTQWTYHEIPSLFTSFRRARIHSSIEGMAMHRRHKNLKKKSADEAAEVDTEAEADVVEVTGGEFSERRRRLRSKTPPPQAARTSSSKRCSTTDITMTQASAGAGVLAVSRSIRDARAAQRKVKKH